MVSTISSDQRGHRRGVRAAGPVSWAVGGVGKRNEGGGGTPKDFVHTG